MGARTTTIRKVTTLRMIIRIGIAPNCRFSLIKLPSDTIGRDRRHVYSIFRCGRVTGPHERVIVGLTPTSIGGRNSTCSLPVTVNVLTTGRIVPTSHLNSCVLVNRLSLSNALHTVGKTLPVTVLTGRLNCGNVVLPRYGTHRTTIIRNLSMCNTAALIRIVSLLDNGPAVRPVIISIRNRFVDDISCDKISFGRIHNRRSIGHTLRITTTNNRGVLVMNPPNTNGDVVDGEFPSVLPPLALDRTLRAAGVRSITKGLRKAKLVAHHPFHGPRRAVDSATVIKKKACPRPNRVSLTRGKILFLSRLPRFGQSILRILHRPLRSHGVAISHTGVAIRCPTDFVLITSVGPYPYNCCGSPARRYAYPPKTIRHCLSHVSKPLLSHVSVRVRVMPIPFSRLGSGGPLRDDTRVHDHIVTTHGVRDTHFTNINNICYGTRVSSHRVGRCYRLTPSNRQLLDHTVSGCKLSTHTCSHVLGLTHAVTSLSGSTSVAAARVTRTVGCHGLSGSS